MLQIREFNKDIWIKSFLFILLFLLSVFASAPQDIPGDEVSEEEYLKFKTSKDTVLNKIPLESPESDLWYDRASQTWLSPSVADQLDASESSLKVGMGGIFVPYMSDPEIEPEIDIVDTDGKIVRRGKCGLIYSVLPGKYTVNVGSGSKNQRIDKKIDVQEGKIKIIRPDWCGLTINVIDENNKIFRGEYEIARIDTFTAYGRGTGNDPTMGDQLETWVLKPGVYKIFNVGTSYSSLKNFTTIRLLPGEYVQYTLVQNGTTFEIIGGGVIDVYAKQKLSSNWRYGIDIGGGADLNVVHDRNDDTLTTNQVDISLLFETRLEYIKDKFDWDIRLRTDEGINFTSFDLSTIKNSIDALRLTSLFTWRVFPNFGPYQRFEGNTEIFSKSVERPDITDTTYFIFLNDDYSLDKIDSVSERIELHPPFSPLLFEAGLGVSANILRTRILDATLLGGLGYTYELQRETFKVGSKSDIKDSLVYHDGDSTYNIENEDYGTLDTIINVNDESYYVLFKAQEKRSEVGPELLLNTYLRLGRAIVMDSEFQLFYPFGRIDSDKGPDIDFRNTISWRLISQLTLDYEFRYNLVQPLEEDLNKQEARHRILLRYSFSRR